MEVPMASLVFNTLAMLTIVQAGGLTTGGLNFDAKRRRAIACGSA